MASNPFDPIGSVGGGPLAPAPSQPGYGGYSYGAPAPAPGMGQQGQQMYGVPPQQQQQQQHPGMQQQYPGMQQQQPQQQAPAPSPVAQDPWSSQPQAQPPQPQQLQQQSYPYGQQQQQQQQPGMQTYHHQQQQPAPAPAANGGYDPFSSYSAPAANQQQQQLVVSEQQSNPYANMVGPTAAANASQSLVPATQPANPWGMPQSQAPSYGAPAAAAAAYDPFAAPAPPPAPVPAPAPAPVPPPAAAPIQEENPFGDFLPSLAPAPAPQPAPAPAPAYDKPPTDEVQIISTQGRQLEQYNSGGGHHQSSGPSSDSRALVPAGGAGPPSPVRNPYAGQLARRAPPGASPLPKAELVKKTGYALSRISFRTIVMKKWKQSYWVQYGSHTMLWFRSQGDFDDWLNNPYHTQAQRNFMIKLAVNFVHDLYKPNVRGYQVTQCRVKPYGNKMVRQFKLERWMDYGPTIAAAFGSYDPKEVDALREAIVECMRNTPLDNGIRATGAVRQQPSAESPSNEQQHGQNYDERSHQREEQNGHGHHNHHNGNMNQRYNSGASAYTQPNPTSQRPAMASRSVVSAADLLDDHHNFDDSASVPATPSRSLVPAHNPSQAYHGAPTNMMFGGAAPQGYPQQQQQQQQYQQPPPPSGYPQVAAPAPSYQQQQYQQPPQQQPPQNAYGQAPPQQSYQQSQYQQPPPPQQYGYNQQQQQQAYPSSYPVQGAQY